MDENPTLMQVAAIRRRVENLLEERSLTAKWLYTTIGMTKTGYRQMWENSTIKLVTLYAIAEALKVSTDELMHGRQSEAAEPPAHYGQRYLEDRVKELEDRMRRVEVEQRKQRAHA